MPLRSRRKLTKAQLTARTAKSAETRKRNHLKRELVRIGEYMVSGGLYFWSGYLVFFICDSLLGWSLWWAKLSANVVGWVVNFMLQRFWVFNDPKLNKQKTDVTARYAVITLVNFMLDYLIVAGLKSIGITPYIGQFISAAFFTVWNYLWYKRWVFATRITRRRKP